MIVKAYLLSSFGVDELGGNPAGVVLNSEKLNDAQKKKIASKIGYSETAFVQKSDIADYKVTFFTPTKEVDLCGHATIATYSHLFNKENLAAGEYTQELKAGILKMKVEKDGTVIMDQTPPQFFDVLPAHEIADLLGIDIHEISSTGLQAQIVSTGLKDIFVPIINRKILFELKPNSKKIALFNKKTDTIGLHVFTLDTINPNSVAHSRNFAPLYGIYEESATGSSTGALACYLYKYHNLKDKQLSHLLFEQGYSMKKPSHIVVSLEADHSEINRVQVGGKATLLGEVEITV